MAAKKPKRRKILLAIVISLAILTSNKVIVNELALLWESEIQPLKPDHPRTAILLGGFAEYDKYRKKVQMADAADRLYEAYRLFKAKQIDTILISGGAASISKKLKPESVYVKQYLIELGVPKSRILLDSTSKNTWENAVNSKQILDKYSSANQFLLITSALHMPRAKRSFNKAGLMVIDYPVHFISNPGRGYTFEDYLIPSSEALTHFDAIIKEWFGLLIYKISGKA